MKHPQWNIAIVTSAGSWMQRHVERLHEALAESHVVTTYHQHEDVAACDIAIYLSYTRIVPADVLARARSNVVVHASDLPRGRGMSPMTWQILAGARSIPVTLFEAVEALDAGPIYLQTHMSTVGNELLPELREALAAITVDMCREFVARFPTIIAEGRPQRGESSVHQRRRPNDSRLDPSVPLAEQFDLLRVVDNERYPAYFTYRGRTFKLTIEPAERED